MVMIVLEINTFSILIELCVLDSLNAKVATSNNIISEVVDRVSTSSTVYIEIIQTIC